MDDSQMFQIPSIFPNLVMYNLIPLLNIYPNKIFSQFVSGGADYIYKFRRSLRAFTPESWSGNTDYG